MCPFSSAIAFRWFYSLSLSLSLSSLIQTHTHARTHTHKPPVSLLSLLLFPSLSLALSLILSQTHSLFCCCQVAASRDWCNATASLLFGRSIAAIFLGNSGTVYLAKHSGLSPRRRAIFVVNTSFIRSWRKSSTFFWYIFLADQCFPCCVKTSFHCSTPSFVLLCCLPTLLLLLRHASWLLACIVEKWKCSLFGHHFSRTLWCISSCPVERKERKCRKEMPIITVWGWLCLHCTSVVMLWQFTKVVY